tara:strand:- start:23184 stop:23648 length:465 start_codon:yes stop_codon:yes gene_type:complete
MYDNLKVLHGLPKPGQKITFLKPIEKHWFTNVVEDQKFLEVGKEYTVRKTHLNSSSTYVWLNEIPVYDEGRDMPFFNLSDTSFEWESPELTECVFLGMSCRSALRVVNFYPDIGIEFDGEVYKEGTPMWVFECDVEDCDRIVKAYLKPEYNDNV